MFNSRLPVVAMLDVLPAPAPDPCTIGMLMYVVTSPLSGYLYGAALPTIIGQVSCCSTYEYFAFCINDFIFIILYMDYMWGVDLWSLALCSLDFEQWLYPCYILGLLLLCGLLRYYGFRLAFHKHPYQNPVRVNNFEREVPEQPWYMRLALV